jgi:hypothetical protein
MAIFIFNRETNFKVIEYPFTNLHTLSILLSKADELILLFALIPNIRCLHVGLCSFIETFESLLWSSIVLPYLVEFHLYGESHFDCTADELIILLRLMPAVQRLVLHLCTNDARLLDGRYIQAALSTVGISHLHSFNYGIEYGGPQLDDNLIINLQETWTPQPIAHTFDAEGRILSLHTIPCIFHRFWPRNSPDKMKTSRLEQKPVSYYGDSAHIIHCVAHQISNRELSTVMQRCSRIESLELWSVEKHMVKTVGKYLENFQDD